MVSESSLDPVIEDQQEKATLSPGNRSSFFQNEETTLKEFDPFLDQWPTSLYYQNRDIGEGQALHATGM